MAQLCVGTIRYAEQKIENTHVLLPPENCLVLDVTRSWRICDFLRRYLMFLLAFLLIIMGPEYGDMRFSECSFLCVTFLTNMYFLFVVHYTEMFAAIQKLSTISHSKQRIILILSKHIAVMPCFKLCDLLRSSCSY